MVNNTKQTDNKVRYTARPLISLVLLFVVFAYSVNASLLAYWSFDTNEAIVTSSDLLTNLTKNGATWEATCKYGGCYYFDGLNDYLDSGTSSVFDSKNFTEFSMCLWHKNVYANQTEQDLIGKDYSNFLIRQTTINKFWGNYNGTADATNYVTAINPDKWHFACSIFNGTTTLNYQDNVYQSQESHKSPILTDNTDLEIGRRSGSNTLWYNGHIDSVRIWNETLNLSDIHNLFYVNSRDCSPNYVYTNWQNISYEATFINRSRTEYDANNCYGSTNTTEYSILLYNHEEVGLLNTINTTIEGGFMIIALIGLWLGLWIFGYHAFLTFNSFLGGTMIIMTIPINVYFAYFFQETSKTGTGFIGWAFVVISILTFAMIPMIKRRRIPTR